VVGGGGRYDELIPLIGGKEVPALGFALYMDKLLDLIEEASLPKRILLRRKALLGEGLRACFEVSAKLRSANYTVEVEHGGEDLTQFDWIASLRKEGQEFALDLTSKTGLQWKGLSFAEATRRLKESEQEN
jgi:histidyl-tRNA synthetase